MDKDMLPPQRKKHFWLQVSISAVVLTLIVVFMVHNVLYMAGAGYEEAYSWLQQPTNQMLSLLLLGGIFYHASLGIRIMTQDYPASPVWRRCCVAILNVLSVVVFLMTALAMHSLR